MNCRVLSLSSFSTSAMNFLLSSDGFLPRAVVRSASFLSLESIGLSIVNLSSGTSM